MAACRQISEHSGQRQASTTDSEQGLESLLAKGWLSLEKWKVFGETAARCHGMGGSPAACSGSICEPVFPFCGMDTGASVEVNPLATGATEPRAPRQLWRGPG